MAQLLQDFLGATTSQLESLRTDTLKSFTVGALPNGTLTQPALFSPACNLHEIIDSLLMATSAVRTEPACVQHGGRNQGSGIRQA